MGYLVFILALLISYLLGSINFAIIISKIFTHDDVRNHGSGNAGMTNVIRTAGKLPGILTLIGDMLKGVAAVAIGRYLLFPYVHSAIGGEWTLPVYGAFLCGICCMLGHIFPVFFGFKGGKAVATTAGIALMLDWRVMLTALAIFLIIFIVTKIVSIGSIFAAASLTVTSALYYPIFGTSGEAAGSRLVITLLALVLSVIIIAKHKDNIVRLMRGEEKKLTSKK